MKKIIFTLAFIALSIPASHAQWWSGSKKITGNGDMTTQSRSVPEYEGVALQGSMNVELVAGKEGQLTVEAESNLSDYILTEVIGGTLKISVEKGINLQPSRNMDIRITVPFEDLDKVSLTGSGNISSKNPINAEQFGLTLTGSGDIFLDLQANDLKGTITGSGDITLKGKAQNFTCVVTGSGDFNALDLQTENAKATITGSGDIQIFAVQELQSRISGSGDIEFKGNPQVQDFKTSGSGTVSKI